MTKSGVLTRLRDADPATPEALDRQVSASARDGIRDEILRTPRGRTTARPRPEHRPRTGRRLAVGAAAAASVAVLVISIGVVSRPDRVGGPATASAAEILRSAGDTARSEPDYVLNGGERIYSGYLGRIVSYDSGPRGGELSLRTDLFSGEWWTDSAGAFLQRTRVYNEEAARKLGIPVGGDDWFEQSARPTDGAEQPMTYAQLRAIPTEPSALTRYLKRSVPGADSVSPRAPTGTVGVATQLLTQPLAPATLRGALYDLLADLPGVVNLGPDKDVYGRGGVLIGYPVGDANSGRGALLIDPSNAMALEERGPFHTPEQLRAQYGPGVKVPAGVGRTRTFVGPTVVDAERAVPGGVTVAPPGA